MRIRTFEYLYCFSTENTRRYYGVIHEERRPVLLQIDTHGNIMNCSFYLVLRAFLFERIDLKNT